MPSSAITGLEKPFGSFQWLSQMGIVEGLSSEDAKRIVLVNWLSLILATSCLFFAPVPLVFSQPIISLSLICLALTFLVSLLFNKQRRYQLAKSWVLIVANGSVLAYGAILGSRSGVHFYCFPLMCYPFLVFSEKEGSKILSGCLAAVISYFLLDQIVYDWKALVAMDELALQIICHGSIALVFVILGAMFFNFHRQNAKSEARLTSHVHKLQREVQRRRNSEATLRVIFDHAQDIIYLVDRDMRFKEINAAVKVYGTTVDDVVGKTIYDMLGPEEAKYYAEHYQSVFDTKQSKDIDSCFTAESGETYWHNLVLSPVFDGDGNVESMIGISRNTTEKKVIEQEIRKAKDEAEAANLAKSRFLAAMSHEIRTPLTAILGFTEILSRPGLTDEMHDSAVRTIDQNGKHLQALIDNILDLAKIEAGKLELDVQQVRLKDQLHPIFELWKKTASEKGIQFSSKIDPKLPEEVPTDPLRLRQILYNIIGNAIKFTEQGEVRVEVGTLEDKGQRLLAVNVFDTGIGIGCDQSERLFAAFSQADRTIVQRYGGSGLGLILSRNLAQRLGGSVDLLMSEEGKGSHFLITVGMGEALETQATKTAQTGAKEPGRLKGKKILVVEDSKDNQVLIRYFLESADAVVEIADDGEKGVKAATDSDVDLILMDIRLPRMDGYEAITHLRQGGFKRPIIALSAHALKEESEKAYAVGANKYLTKPIRSEVLIGTVAKMLEPN